MSRDFEEHFTPASIAPFCWEGAPIGFAAHRQTLQVTDKWSRCTAARGGDARASVALETNAERPAKAERASSHPGNGS